MANKSKTVTYEDKETETSSSLMERTHTDSSNDLEDNNVTPMNAGNYQDEEENCEPFDKMCPICGDKYQKETAFADFQAHVENHFVGENETESMENFDTVPNSLDNVM